MARSKLLSDEEKLKRIHQATFETLLQYGFSKTSLEDIARLAGMSRSSLYLHYKNKNDIVVSTIEATLQERLVRAKEIINGNDALSVKLYNIIDIWFLELWSLAYESLHRDELFTLKDNLLYQTKNKADLEFKTLLNSLFKDKELAEIIFFAIKGYQTDVPSNRVLQKRIKTLIDRLLG